MAVWSRSLRLRAHRVAEPAGISVRSTVLFHYAYEECRNHPHRYNNQSCICPMLEARRDKDTFIEESDRYLDQTIDKVREKKTGELILSQTSKSCCVVSKDYTPTFL